MRGCARACVHALCDQTGSAWVLQAQRMERSFLGVVWLPSQIQAVNPLLILVLVPLASGGDVQVPRGGRRLRWPGLYALAARSVGVTPLRKIGLGLYLLALAFCISLQVHAPRACTPRVCTVRVLPPVHGMLAADRAVGGGRRQAEHRLAGDGHAPRACTRVRIPLTSR